MLSDSNYINQLQSYEEYAFSWEELLQNCDIPLATLEKEVLRLIGRNEIVNLRRGFYLIMPPRYKNFGRLPLQLYVDKLFKFLNKPYYIGLHSAASFHGASHQQVQGDYVITTPPAFRGVDKANIKLQFFNTSSWSEKNIQQKKSYAGLFNVSSPALTTADLVNYHSKIGGINRMLANLKELSEEIQIEDLKALLSWYSNKSTIQRLGFLLEEVGMEEKYTDLIFDRLKQDKFYPVLLSPKKGTKAGGAGNKWKVDVNIKLESDL
ncbi:MAG: putative transcriptional regulator of viral defense system [Ulvibacter sp.]